MLDSPTTSRPRDRRRTGTGLRRGKGRPRPSLALGWQTPVVLFIYRAGGPPARRGPSTRSGRVQPHGRGVADGARTVDGRSESRTQAVGARRGARLIEEGRWGLASTQPDFLAGAPGGLQGGGSSPVWTGAFGEVQRQCAQRTECVPDPKFLSFCEELAWDKDPGRRSWDGDHFGRKLQLSLEAGGRRTGFSLSRYPFDRRWGDLATSVADA